MCVPLPRTILTACREWHHRWRHHRLQWPGCSYSYPLTFLARRCATKARKIYVFCMSTEDHCNLLCTCTESLSTVPVVLVACQNTQDSTCRSWFPNPTPWGPGLSPTKPSAKNKKNSVRVKFQGRMRTDAGCTAILLVMLLSLKVLVLRVFRDFASLPLYIKSIVFSPDSTMSFFGRVFVWEHGSGTSQLRMDAMKF